MVQRMAVAKRNGQQNGRERSRFRPKKDDCKWNDIRARWCVFSLLARVFFLGEQILPRRRSGALLCKRGAVKSRMRKRTICLGFSGSMSHPYGLITPTAASDPCFFPVFFRALGCGTGVPGCGVIHTTHKRWQVSLLVRAFSVSVCWKAPSFGCIREQKKHGSRAGKRETGGLFS